MRATLLLPFLLLTSAPAATARELDLPLRVPGAAGVSGAAYRSDLIELRLTPAATRTAVARTAGRMRSDALGVAGVDRVANSLGAVWFEPLFPGETPPAPGSDDPDFTSYYVAHLPTGVGLGEALDRFEALPEVANADPVGILPVNVFPNDSLWSVSDWYYNGGTRRDVHAPEAWDITVGDTAIVVAVLDTGVLTDHPDLEGVSGQIWTNWIEAGGAAGVDDDGNGYVDDVHGWDFVTGAPDGLPGEDANIEDNDPNDFVGHGTAVAGLVGAITDNGIGVAGMAWRVRIMPVRMGWASTFSPSGEVQMNFAARAVRYATRNGATVINCSWASLETDGIGAAVTAAVRAGITVVVSAGNGTQPNVIATRDDVLAVAATDSTDTIASFSRRGPYVDLCAPGVDIQTTWSNQYQPAYSAPLDGTSFSAPLVSGAVALIQSRALPPLAPRLLTPRGVQLRLMEAADDITAQNPFSPPGTYGAGRLNAYRALTQTTGSTATRARARSVGSPVLVPTDGPPHVAFLTTNRRLIVLDTVTQDSVLDTNTFGTPNGSLAAARVDCSLGTALFYATLDEGVNGIGADGTALPGTWPQPGSAPFAMYGPALGDLDGDGAIEVVSGGDDGQLWAWHVDGSLVSGYPIAIGASALTAGPALSDLDGVPGVEVVVAASDGTVHAFGAGGAPLAGWPVPGIPDARAPVIGQLGSYPSPTVLIAARYVLHALAPDGSNRNGFPVLLAGRASQDPALADLDGDGHDEIIVATESPARLEVYDQLGESLTALHWPRPLPATAQGPPVVGELATGSPGPEILIQRGGSLLALESDADSIATFPKPGGAGPFPSLGQTDGDAAAEVVAGTGSDSLFYIYDAGAGSSAAGAFPWPTARGNYARTGSRLYAPTGVSVSPCPVADLRVTARTDSSVTLAWTATGDDGTIGRPQFYTIRGATAPIDEATFGSAPLTWIHAATTDAGGSESLVLTGLLPATRYWFALKAVDDGGNVSSISNLVQAQTGVGGPIGARTGIALDVAPRPSRGAAEFFWQASADGEGGRQSIHLFDTSGRRIRVLEVGTSAGGRMNWDGRDAEGRSVPAGLYYARLLSGSFHTQTRLVLLP